MKVEVKDAPKSQKQLHIELPYEVFLKAREEECGKVAKKSKIPGFRPGKAPKDLVFNQSKHLITSNALEAVINNALKEALINNGINPLSSPDVRDVVLEEDKPLTFDVLIDVYPEFEIAKFSGFSFDRTLIKVEDKDVEDVIEQIRKESSEYKASDKKRGVENGDRALIDFIGKLDGVPFEGGAGEKYPLNIGSGQFIPGFEEQIIGMKAGEKRDINVKFPDEYHNSGLAGKDVVFEILLHEIQEKVMPELNDEFAKKNNAKSNNMEELKVFIKRDLQYEADRYVKFTTFTEMLQKIADENGFDVPVSVVKEQAQRMAYQNLQQYRGMGINPADFGLTAESLMDELMPEAEKQVKRALIVNKLADINSIKVDDSDVDAEVAELAAMAGKTPEEIKEDINKNKYMESFRNDILSDKVYKFLCGENKLKDREITRSEFEEEKLAEKKKAKETEDGKKSGSSKKVSGKSAKSSDDDKDDDVNDEKPKAKRASRKKADEKEDSE